MIISDELFFLEIESELANKKKWVVALSGGADSLCLTLLANVYAKKNNIELFACIVDHRLRKESSTEIIPAIELLRKNNITHKIFVWNHPEKIVSNIEKKARIVRYEFLYQYCREVSSSVLMTAHHALDQWETFFMRLSKGSSLKGLSCIKKISKFDDIFLARPMLNFSPDDIKETLKQRFKITKYVNDPSNKELRFERARWRTAYEDMSEKYGLSIASVNKSIERIQASNDCIIEISESLSKQIFDGSYLNIKEFQSLHLELKIRILDNILSNLLPQKNRIISYSLLKVTSQKICEKSFVATNLSGLILKKDKTKNVKIYEENRF
ncbi:MAG: tRNA lysidine(34) synthetase TilS [Holosporales bacterium]|jgi:tRNA(Ile)-lysidine synthase|nr:tRNA lysidine(34) synthetase TilS [Holosporales bacterium]